MRWWRRRERERERERRLRRGRLRLRDDERLELRDAGPELRDDERLRDRDHRRLERPEPEADGEAFSCGEPGHMSFTYLDTAAEDMASSLGTGLLPQAPTASLPGGALAKARGTGLAGTLPSEPGPKVAGFQAPRTGQRRDNPPLRSPDAN